MILHIGSVKRLKLLYDDFPPNVARNDINAKIPRVIIILKPDIKLRDMHLKALSMSNFKMRLGVVGLFILNTIMKWRTCHRVCMYYMAFISLSCILLLMKDFTIFFGLYNKS